MGVCTECHSENLDSSVQCMVCGALLSSVAGAAIDEMSDPSLQLEFGKPGEKPRRKAKGPAGFVGAPPSSVPPLPRLVPALPQPRGLASLLQYSLGCRGTVPRQREALRQLSAELARQKKFEAYCTMAVGRAARKQGLLPREVRDLAAEANHQDLTAAIGTEKAEKEHQQQVAAETAGKAVLQAAQARLAQLRHNHEPLLARVHELRHHHAALKERLVQLEALEQNLRQESQKDVTEEEIGGEMRLEDGRIVVTRRSAEEEQLARRSAYAATLTERTQLQEQLQEVASQFAAHQQPLQQIEQEMAQVEGAILTQQERVRNAEAGAQVAAQSAQRRSALANRSSAEIDEEIGGVLLRKEILDPSLELLHRAVARCRKRLGQVEDAISHQQDELDLFDAKAARRSSRLLMGGIVVLLFALTAAGGTLAHLF